jgi:isoquinoline 1-oxidoreductase beta subunit
MMRTWTRRTFVATGGLVGGGLALGIAGLAFAPNRLSVVPKASKGPPRLTTWITIAPDNTITVTVPHCEMGQGVQTALAMMAAEELEADWNLVHVEEAPAEDDFANGYLVRVFMPAVAKVPKFMERGVDFGTFKLTQLLDVQTTGGSSAVRGTGQLGMRAAGAAAKAMLIEAAAKRWNVPASQCLAQSSKVVHASSNQVATFGELASDAALLQPVTHPVLKLPDTYTIVGKPTRRFDTPSKVNGSAMYGIDVVLPGMLYATVAAAPIFGGKLGSVATATAESAAGVKKVVKLDNAVAVVADSYWRALKALRGLTPVFTDTGKSTESSATIFAAIGKGLEGDDNKKVHASGDATAALGGAAKTVEAEYRVPFLAHATMEPMNATARMADGRCEVWTGVQDPLAARKVAAQASGLSASKVTIHNQQLGGGFGRRLPGAHDFVEQAVRIAKAVAPVPVKLIWSREEDIQRDYYRPAVIGRFKGAIDSAGAPTVWISRFNSDDGDGAAQTAYRIANQDIRFTKDSHHIRMGAWRSVAHSQHGFFSESFIDELAHAAGKDPYEYRRTLLENSPRHRAVLEKAAWIAGWGTPPPAGRSRGIAIVECFGTIVAEVAEVEIVAGAVKVHRVFAAVDCGRVINPDTAAAQIEGGIIFGLSAALFSEITIANGRVAQANFSDYLLPKLADAPAITVEFINSGAPLGGLGEPGVPPIAPAIANAIFAAMGKRLRTLPLRI